MLRQPLTAGWSRVPGQQRNTASSKLGCGAQHACKQHTHTRTCKRQQVAGLHGQVAQNVASTAGMGEGPPQPRLGCQQTLLPLPPPPLNTVTILPRQRIPLTLCASDNHLGRNHASMDVHLDGYAMLHQCSSTVSAAVCTHAHRSQSQKPGPAASMSTHQRIQADTRRHSETLEVSRKD